MNTTSMTKAFYLLWTVVLVGFGLVFFFLWHNFSSSNQQSTISLDQLSLRQHQDSIQYRLSDGDWQTITTVSALTSKDGENGADGADGKDGTNGLDGTDGQDGSSGIDGVDGAQGVKGDTGATGATGQAGQDGQDGQDGADGISGTDGKDGTNGLDGTDGQDGTNGREIELQKDLYFIQWRYVGEPGWRNLIAYSEIKGDKGDKGDTGGQGPIGLTGPAGPSVWGGISGDISTQTDLQNMLDSKVGLTGNQTIAGTKTFSSALITPSGTNIGGVLYLTGTGFPEGVVSAPVGSKYIDTAVTNGAHEWMKKTGTGNTGWVVAVGDTGWRKISWWDVEDVVNGEPLPVAASTNGAPGFIAYRRLPDRVEFLAKRLTGAQSGQARMPIPVGFRSRNRQIYLPSSSSSTSYIGLLYGSIDLPSASVWETYVHWPTIDVWPTVLPGEVLECCGNS